VSILADYGNFRVVRKAVIDVGSNSVLLTIEEQSAGGWTPVFEHTDVTSLGEGTKETGLLSERGIAATLTALKSDFEHAKNLGCNTVVAAATMAARIASNKDDFLARAQKQGTPVSILSGNDEAELGFRSVVGDPVFSTYERISIVDVGGQSTELVTAERTERGWTTLFRRSFPVGTLGLRGGVLSDESPGFKPLLAAVCEIDDLIGMIYLPNQAGHTVCLGATGTNLVTIRDAMTKWDPSRVHRAWLDYEEVSKAVSMLCPMTDEERRAVIGMEPGRERTLHIGALILERFLHAIRSLGCSVSVRGWRHALLEEGMPSSIGDDSATR
jgi:exopolyphosphatase / guanosine-5'-triphosphate,3'-diphosphate pyrophosphatase